jgi:hypothetical protein
VFQRPFAIVEIWTGRVALISTLLRVIWDDRVCRAPRVLVAGAGDEGRFNQMLEPDNHDVVLGRVFPTDVATNFGLRIRPTGHRSNLIAGKRLVERFHHEIGSRKVSLFWMVVQPFDHNIGDLFVRDSLARAR